MMNLYKIVKRIVTIPTVVTITASFSLNACKTAETDSQTATSDDSLTEIAPDGKTTRGAANSRHFVCNKPGNAGQATVAVDSGDQPDQTTLKTMASLVTQYGQVPPGSYKLMDGSPVDGSCLEFFADVSSVIKVSGAESSGLIVSNCDGADENEWRIKAYIRRTDGRDAEIVMDEFYSCDDKQQ